MIMYCTKYKLYLFSLLFICIIGCITYPKANLKISKNDYEFSIVETNTHVGHIKLSPNGRYAIYCDYSGDRERYVVFDILEGKQLLRVYFNESKTFGAKSYFGVMGKYFDFSNDSRYCALIYNPDQILIFDLDYKKISKKIKIKNNLNSIFITFSNDSKYLVVIAEESVFSENDNLIIYDFEKDTKIYTTIKKAPNFEVINNNIHLIVFGSYIHIFDFNGKNIKEIDIKDLSSYIYTIKQTKGGKEIYVLDILRGNIILLETENFEIVSKIENKIEYQKYLDFDITNDNNNITIITEEYITVMENQNGNIIKKIPYYKNIRGFHIFNNLYYSINYLPNNEYVIASKGDILRIINVNTGEEVASFIGFNNDEWIVTTSEGYYNCSAKGDIYYKVKSKGKELSYEEKRALFYKPEIVKATLAKVFNISNIQQNKPVKGIKKGN